MFSVEVIPDADTDAADVARALSVLGTERVPGTATGLRVWDAEAEEVTTLR